MATLVASVISPSSKREFKSELETESDVINLMIFFDNRFYQQALDVMKDSSWKLECISNITKIENVINKYPSIDNIYLVHHGRRYCHEGASDPKLFFLHDHMSRALNILIEPLSEAGVNIAFNSEEAGLSPAEYIDKLCHTIDERWGPREDSPIPDTQLEQLEEMKRQVIIYTYISYLLNSISDNGNYISIACNEGEKEESIKLLGSFVKGKNITLYANTNKSYIELKAQRDNPNDPVIDPKTKKQKIDAKTKKKMYNAYSGLDNIGGFFRIPLTPNFNNTSGWVKCQISSDGSINVTSTGKDLILNNYQQNKKSFELITSGTYTNNQIEDILFYYSKKYKTKAIELWGEIHYKEWCKIVTKK
ncbi:hypothetical protein [Dysgonomonas sp. 25]|uniref:hypothetical protein n=1 Tax=Dysgonomonas sp. 25 TaxID=2302933 RepID=UPI0013D5BBE3|nr:hypothetical protein [Dysgonomonas sp. 25]NDV67900.1 hypothetical protein [Dysgonomonas sp. 25]